MTRVGIHSPEEQAGLETKPKPKPRGNLFIFLVAVGVVLVVGGVVGVVVVFTDVTPAGVLSGSDVNTPQNTPRDGETPTPTTTGSTSSHKNKTTPFTEPGPSRAAETDTDLTTASTARVPSSLTDPALTQADDDTREADAERRTQSDFNTTSSQGFTHPVSTRTTADARVNTSCARLALTTTATSTSTRSSTSASTSASDVGYFTTTTQGVATTTRKKKKRNRGK